MVCVLLNGYLHSDIYNAPLTHPAYMSYWYRFSLPLAARLLLLLMLWPAPAHAADDPISIADARAQGEGATVLIEGVVTRAFGDFVRLQDTSGDLGASGMVVRQQEGPLSEDFRAQIEDGTIGPGTILQVEGEISEFFTLQQINNEDLASFSVEGTTDVPEPLDVTLSTLSSDGPDYESILVRVEDVTIQESGRFGEAQTYTADDATGTLPFRIQRPAETELINLFIPSEPFTYEGVVGIRNDEARLNPVLVSDLITDEDLEDPGDADIVTIAEARALGEGSTVTVEGIVTRARGRLTRIQDETAAIAVFDGSEDFASSVNQGDLVRVTAERDDFRGQVQLTNIDDALVLSSGSDLPEPVELTVSEVNAEGIDFESQLVRITGLTVDTDDTIFDADESYDVVDDTATGEMRVQRSSDSGLVGQPVPQEAFTYEGVLGSFDGNPQLTPVLATDVRVGDDDFDLDDILVCEIQGTGFVSPLVDQRVTTRENVVTALATNGFFMQMATRQEECPETASQGVFVFQGGAPTVTTGDEVTVTATPEDRFGWTQLSSSPEVEVTGTAPLPEPITFNATTPDPGPFDVPALYRYQSMVVQVNNAIVTSPTDRFGNFVVDANGTFALDRNFRQPGVPYPGEAPFPTWDGNQHLFEIEPSPNNFPSDFDAEAFRGATVSATGPLVFSFDEHVLWPTDLTIENPAEEEVLRGIREREQGEAILGTLNLFDLFGPGEGDSTPGGYQNRLDKLSRYVCDLMQSPDILGVQESGGDGSMQDLADRIQATCGTAYDTFTGTPDNRGIRNGALVQTDIANVEVQELGADETLSFRPDQRVHDRPPLLVQGEVSRGGATVPLSVLVVHNRSRIGIEDGNTDFVRGKRFEQARSIAQMAQDLQTADPGIRLAALGDFNAFEFTDGRAHVLGELTNTTVPGEQELEGPFILDRPFVNQVLEVDSLDRYSFIFEGSAQVLDHILTNDRLTPLVTDRAYIRANTDAPYDFISDATTPFTSSDHDGMAMLVDLTAAEDEEVTVSIDQSFADFTDPSSYRLIGVPGLAGVAFENTFGGTSGTSYRIFADNGLEGAPNTYLEEQDGSDVFVLGRGYWALARDNWTVEADVLAPQLTADGAFDLPLQSGWNIIVNPFDTALDWNQVQADNEVNDPQPLWAFDGDFESTFTFTEGTTGEAYYYLNATNQPRLTLTPDAQQASQAAATLRADERMLTLEAHVAGERRGRVELGTAAQPRSFVAPRAPFGGAMLHAVDEDDRRLATHVQAADRSGPYTFDLVVEGAAGNHVTLRPARQTGLDDYGLTLHLPDGETVDLRHHDDYTLTLEQDHTSLQLVLADADELVATDRPDAVELRGNYPNPFSTETTIEYAIPERAAVQLEVFNVLGQRVAMLVDEVQPPGRYDVQWDGRSDAGHPLASGVYIARLTVNGETRSDRITYVP